MRLNFQTNIPLEAQMSSHTIGRGDRAAVYAAGDTQAASAAAAYVYNVDPAAEAKSVEMAPDAPLSDAEIEQLYNAYLELGKDHPLWEEIGTLLTETLAGNDRTNFLSMLSTMDAENMEGYVLQVSRLEGDDRSLFLSTALRNGTGRNIENLVEAATHLSGEQLSHFLETADGLGRTRESIQAGELQNFIQAAAAVAEDSPATVDRLAEKALALEDEDRALFLKAAAHAGDELGALMDTTDLLSGSSRTRFLEAAGNAGDGISNLLSLTQNLEGERRTRFLSFTSTLGAENTENFLLATQGAKENLPGLMSVTGSLAGKDRDAFLSLAKNAGPVLDRLINTVDSLSENPDARSGFLSTAVRAGDGFNDFLSVAEKLGGAGRAKVLSFAADLGFTDLGSFIEAAKHDTANAVALAETAVNLDGKSQSYLLYAAAQNPDHQVELTATAQRLNGDEQKDFLFAAANMAAQDPTDPDAPDPMQTFLRTTNELAASRRGDFLAEQRMVASGLAGGGLAAEYAYLNSVFDEKDFSAVLAAGEENIDRLMSQFDQMDVTQREAFFSVAEKAGKEVLPELVSVMARLDEERSLAFVDYASSLGGKSISNLVVASEQALKTPGNEFGAFDRLMETVTSLDPAVDQDFLNAAAKSGKELGRLMDLTNRLSGFLQGDFLRIADAMAERGDGLLSNFLSATEYLIEEKGYLDVPLENHGNRRPSDLIRDGVFQGELPLEGFFKSSLFLVSVGISNTHMNDWFNTWQGIPKQV